jgi:N-acetylglucosaminyldiphosphoundecaprenol N-acetyl-beta-D-mannosaminyltransferase
MLASRVPAVPAPPVGAVRFMGVTVNLLTSYSLLDLVTECVATNRTIVIANHNLHSLCLHSSSSREAAAFRRFYDDAQYTVADGMSIVVLGKLYGQEIDYRHRIAYNDWLPLMLPIAVQNGWRVFYLGSTAEVAAKGTLVLTARFPGLQLKARSGHFDVRRRGVDNNEVLAEISRFKPQILFVGMGMPRQERWILENRGEIDANVIFPSGATLDYIAGAKRMAPRWMGALGLEWAFRLATEPRRLAARYLVEPWGLLAAVVTNSLQTSRDRVAPAQQEEAK